jgi:DNA-binding transcriptional LysR family regulator
MTRTTLRRLEVFVAVVDAGGFRACSDQLDISPAAVSHQVSQLEEEIGYSLFSRRRGRVCGLTEQGAKAYREAKDFLGHAVTLENELRGRKKTPRRRLSVLADPILDAQLARQVAAFASAHPALDVALSCSHFEEMVDRMGTGDADFAYFYSAGPVQELPSDLVWHEPISICARHDHPIFSKQPLEFQELRGFPFVAPPSGAHFRRSVDRLFRQRGVDSYNVVLETGNANVAREAVVNGFAISAVITCYLHQELARQNVRPVAISGPALTLEVRRAVRPGMVPDRTSSAFTQCLDDAHVART